jgi:uncharacterized repeat protein (TIGR01451 family)
MIQLLLFIMLFAIVITLGARAISQSSRSWPRPVALSLIVLGAMMAVVIALPYLPALAEGSQDLIDSGGDRPWLEDQLGVTAGINRTNILEVYANAGETINLGSSAMGLGGGDILFRSPTSLTASSCFNDVRPGGAPADWGRIDNINEEQAGPLPNTGGYIPCVVTVTAATQGIWEIEFKSPNPGSNPNINPVPISATTAWAQANNRFWIAAWDVTVMTGTTPLKGRVFANYLPLNMGSFESKLDSEVFILTNDGYIYRVDLNGQQPFGFIFFSNNRGFINSQTDENLYRSVQLTTLPPVDQFIGNDSIHPPNATDTANSVTHKIFFNMPDPTMPATAPAIVGGLVTNTWLYTSPILPPAVTNFGFFSFDGTPGVAGVSPPGGKFIFNASGFGTAEIVLDFDGNNIPGTGNDKVLQFQVRPGLNEVVWDGLDGAGTLVPPGPLAYNAHVRTGVGEVHFPFFDVENNEKGFVIERLNGDGAPDDTVYFNDTAVGGNVSDLINGTGSINGAHDFNLNFGDHKGIDTWTYRASEFTIFTDAVQVSEADLQVLKLAPATVVAGETITYTIIVTNAGPSDALQAPVRDTLPPQILNPSWSCQVVSGVGVCGPPASGSGTISTSVTLSNTAVAAFTLVGRVLPSASGNIQNSVVVSPAINAVDPFTPNNTSTATTTVIVSPLPPAPELEISKSFLPALTPGQALKPGDVITYVLAYRNIGTDIATGVVISDLIPFNTTYVPGSVTVDTGSVLFIDENGLLQPTQPTTVTGLHWNVGNLPPDGLFRQVSFVVRINTILTDPAGGLVVQYSPEGWVVLEGDVTGLSLVELNTTTTITAEATPTLTPSPAVIATISPTPELTTTPTVTATVEPEPTTEPTEVITATATPDAPAETPTSEPTAEPVEVTPAATAEPAPTEESASEPATDTPTPEAPPTAESTSEADLKLPSLFVSMSGLSLSILKPAIFRPEMTSQTEITPTDTSTITSSNTVVETTLAPTEEPTLEPSPTLEITEPAPAASSNAEAAEDYPVVALEELLFNIDNVAVIGGNNITPTNSNTTTTPVLRVVDPSLTKAVSVDQAVAGDIVDFEIIMTNPSVSNAPATRVTLTDPVPDYLEVLDYDFDSSPPGLVTGDRLVEETIILAGQATIRYTVILTVPTLSPNEQVFLNIRTQVKDFVKGPLTIRNEAVMKFAEGSPRRDEDQLIVPTSPPASPPGTSNNNGGGGDDDDDDDETSAPPPLPPAPPATTSGGQPAPTLPVVFLPETGLREVQSRDWLLGNILIVSLVLAGMAVSIFVWRQKRR